jgi:hypothetical protein
MSNATVSQLGLKVGGSDAKELFLKVWSGEVISAFETQNTTMDKHTVHTISSGKQSTFPILGKATASYHAAGNEITGGSIGHNERVIGIQGLLIAPVFIAEIEQAMNYYDVRSFYSKEIGNVLATTMDKHVYQTLINASRDAGLSPQDAGVQVTSANFLTSGADAAEAIYEAAQKLDEADVPENDRYAAVSPATYYNLVKDTTAATINRDFGGEGSYADGKVLKIAGINVIKTNNLPNGQNITTGVLDGSDGTLGGNFTTTAGVVWHKSAVGTVKLLDLSTEMERDIRRQGTLMVSKYAVGHGILRPRSAVEIKTA